MSWAKAKEQAQAATSAGKFFKLENKQKARVVFLGEPYGVEREFEGKKSTRIAVNLVNVASIDTVQVWEMSPSTFNALFDQIEVKGQNAVYVVSRNGEGFKTSYSFIHEKDLTDEQKNKLAKLELHDLGSGSPDAGNDAGDEDEVPF